MWNWCYIYAHTMHGLLIHIPFPGHSGVWKVRGLYQMCLHKQGIASYGLANTYYTRYGIGDRNSFNIQGSGVKRKPRWRQRSERGSVIRLLTQMGNERIHTVCVYLLITGCAWFHTFPVLPMPALLKRWICFQQCDYCLWVSNLKCESKRKKERIENCLLWLSATVCVAFLSVVIGPFIVAGDAGRGPRYVKRFCPTRQQSRMSLMGEKLMDDYNVMMIITL